MPTQAKPGRGRLQAFALAGPDQPLQVDRRPPASLPVPHLRQEWREPILQIFPPVCLRHHPPPNGQDRATDQTPTDSAKVVLVRPNDMLLPIVGSVSA